MKRRSGVSRFFSGCLTALIAIASVGNSYESALYAQEKPAQDLGGLTIAIIKGEEKVNIIKKKTATKPVVEVRDRNKLPVAGASVVFLLPSSGPSATFANGARTLTVVTDSSGRAAVSSIQPTAEVGNFNINVTASYKGQTATTNIAQKNFLTVQAAKEAGVASSSIPGGVGLGTTLAVVGAVAAGIGTAAVVTQKPRRATIGNPTEPTLGPPNLN
jgi:hypothetical protein